MGSLPLFRQPVGFLDFGQDHLALHGLARKEDHEKIRAAQLFLNGLCPASADGQDLVDEDLVLSLQRVKDQFGDLRVWLDIPLVADENPRPKCGRAFLGVACVHLSLLIGSTE